MSQAITQLQSVLPLEPVNRARLDTLKAERAASRVTMTDGAGRFGDRRRHAQIAARHALQRVAAGLPARAVARSSSQDGGRAWTSAVHAAEIQLPESWLPFVVSQMSKPSCSSVAGALRGGERHLAHAILSTGRNAERADAAEAIGSASFASLG